VAVAGFGSVFRVWFQGAQRARSRAAVQDRNTSLVRAGPRSVLRSLQTTGHWRPGDNVLVRLADLVRLLLVLSFAAAALVLSAAGPGFRSERQFDEHYAKHGSEFGHISKAEYLHRAQQLRDAPVGGPVLEIRRSDGTVSRFDKRNGYFGAYNRDGTIRTFFIPAAGESYFQRQAKR